MHKYLEELLSRNTGFFRSLKRPRDVSEILRVLCVDIMINEKRQKGGFFDNRFLTFINWIDGSLPTIELKSSRSSFCIELVRLLFIICVLS